MVMDTVPASMKVLLGLGLLTLLLPSVVPIRCYVCSASATNEQCNHGNQTCPPLLDTCLTIVNVVGDAKSIVKQCASQPICLGAMSAATVDENGNSVTVNCCNSNNLCNVSGAGAIAIHQALLALALLLLLLVVQ